MTNVELIHYLKGGMFTGIYNPPEHDISNEAKQMIGKEIIVHQNMLIAPLQNPDRWKGQHAFNSSSIYGWFPEQDINDLTIIPKFIDNPETLPIYMYKLVYTKESQLIPNFGNGDWKIPMIIHREYSVNNDEQILELSKPQATEIHKAIYNGITEIISWERMEL